jgi:hypothetical protein
LPSSGSGWWHSSCEHCNALGLSRNGVQRGSDHRPHQDGNGEFTFCTGTASLS